MSLLSQVLLSAGFLFSLSSFWYISIHTLWHVHQPYRNGLLYLVSFCTIATVQSHHYCTLVSVSATEKVSEKPSDIKRWQIEIMFYLKNGVFDILLLLYIIFKLVSEMVCCKTSQWRCRKKCMIELKHLTINWMVIQSLLEVYTKNLPTGVE